MKIKAFKTAFPLTLPVMAGYIFLGIGFGILLESIGYSFLWSFAMGFFIFAGSMQYASIRLITAGASLPLTAFMTFIIQIRHLFYGLSMIEKYKNAGKYKPLLIHELTDETYSLVCSCKIPEDIDPKWFYLAISILNHLYWIIGCTVGGLMGSAITFDTTGIDFAMTALFIVICTDQWLSSKDHRPALIGLITTAMCLFLFGESYFIIPSLLVITALLTLLRKQFEQEVNDNDSF